MKAKRLLAAFVAVAMMVTTFVAMGTVAYAGGTDEEKCTVEITITEATAEELEAEGLTAPADKYVYWISATISDYGTLSSTNAGAGRKLNNFNVSFKFDDVVSTYFDTSEDVVGTFWAVDASYTYMAAPGVSSLPADEGKVLNIGWMGTGQGRGAYPTGNVASMTDAMEFFKIPFVAHTNNFTVAVPNVVCEIVNFTSNTVQAGTEDWSYNVGKMNAPTSITVGEAGGEDEPTIEVGNTVAENNGGVAFTNGSDVYDNAFAVSATINAATASKIGVLFIPDWALGTGEALTIANGADAPCTDSAIISRGSVTIRAAIKNIPRKYEGTPINLLTRAYAVVDGEYVYAEDTITTEVLFGAAE